MGNAQGVAALEITAAGPTLSFRSAMQIAVTGAPLEVFLDGQPVDAKSLAQGEQQVSGQTCKDFNGIIRAWPTGKHTIKITMRLDAKINDGWNDYAAGDYVEIYNITVKP